MTRRGQDACIECGAPASHRLLCETCAELEQYRETVEEKDMPVQAAMREGRG